MDSGKEILFEERRIQRSNEVRIQFVTPDYFNVLDDEGNLKYVGSVGDKFDCTCQSFMQGNNTKYSTTHSEVFKCKHLLKALMIRYGS